MTPTKCEFVTQREEHQRLIEVLSKGFATLMDCFSRSAIAAVECSACQIDSLIVCFGWSRTMVIAGSQRVGDSCEEQR